MSLSGPQLRVLSAFCTDFAVVWFAAMFATREFITIALNIVLGLCFLYIAIKAEHTIETL